MEINLEKIPSFVRLKNFGKKNLNILIDVKLDIPNKTLLNPSKLDLKNKEKYGLLGKNGVGKTLLMESIHKRDAVFSNIPPYISTFILKQELEKDDRTPFQFVLDSNKELNWLIKAEKIALGRYESEEYENYLDKYEDLLENLEYRLREINANKSENDVVDILIGLGFNEDEIKTKKYDEFSGGWKMRISLACGLFNKPDLLILDEPTNHLDINAVIWLENYLEEYEKSLLIVSHDTNFLNNICNHIIHFSNKELKYYKGNYYSFLRATEEERKILEKDKRKNKLKSKKEKSPPKEKSININLLIPEKLSETAIVKFENVDFSYPNFIEGLNFCEGQNNTMFQNLDFGIYMDSKIGFMGSNGTGKSTIIKLIKGELKEKNGHIWRNQNLRVSYFNQHHFDKFNNMEQTPIEFLMKSHKISSEYETRCYLARFGIKDKQPLQPISTFSGGQKSLIALADIIYNNPHILLLDEPTNHLDIESIDSLLKGLINYKGAIILISHNQYVIESLVQELWIFKNFKIKRFKGSFNEYKSKKIFS